jgi:hypothetical protein
MISVFVAGSRALSRLNPQLRERLDNIIRQNFTILIGDANGADRAVQAYLAKRAYQQVVVYCMEACRNNVGEWPARLHAAEPSAKRDRHYYGIKDSAMSRDATCGFMLWDGVSKGTLTNVINLLNADKKVLLYIGPKKQFFNLRSFEHLHQALNANGIKDVSGFLDSLRIKEPASQHLPFASLG